MGGATCTISPQVPDTVAYAFVDYNESGVLDPSRIYYILQERTLPVHGPTPAAPIPHPRSLINHPLSPFPVLTHAEDLYHSNEDVDEIKLKTDTFVDWISLHHTLLTQSRVV